MQNCQQHALVYTALVHAAVARWRTQCVQALAPGLRYATLRYDSQIAQASLAW